MVLKSLLRLDIGYLDIQGPVYVGYWIFGYPRTCLALFQSNPKKIQAGDRILQGGQGYCREE
jgi:hypothetical protein